MKSWRQGPLVVWAAGDLVRTPAQSLLLFFAVATLTGLVAVVLLLDRSLSLTCDRLMAQTPAVVVRRITAGGWAPLPVGEALARVSAIPGVVRPRARLWGVVSAETGPVTVVAYPEQDRHDPAAPPPGPGQALAGPGITAVLPGSITLKGSETLTFTLTGRLPAALAMAAHDLVLVHPADARRLLGLSADQASDLALDVYHEEEVPALCADLDAVFPWPVRIGTRAEQRRRYRADIAQRTSLALLAFIPAVLALAFLVSGLGMWAHRQQYQSGVLKALGWTNADLMRLSLVRGVLVGLPAAICGSGCAYFLLYAPGVTWISQRLYGWPTTGTAWYLNPGAVAAGLLPGLLLVGLPYLLAVVWSAWQSIKTDPANALQER